MKHRAIGWISRTFLLLAFCPAAVAQTRPATTTTTAAADDPIARIRDEGLNRSQVMQTLSYLTDVIGPRLTASPGARRAGEWTRDRLTAFGLSDARVEPWGELGRGWSLERFSAQVVEPQAMPLIAYPKAWSPGLDQVLRAEVVYIDARAESDLEKYRGKLLGAIVLFSPPRDVDARWDPLASRMSDSDLLRLANAEAGSPQVTGLARALTPAERREMLAGPIGRAATRPSTQPSSTRPSAAGSVRSPALNRALWKLVMKEGPALLVTPSPQFDGGTLLVGAAITPQSQMSESATRPQASRPAGNHPAWAKDAQDVPPQIVLATEQYNRLVRMIALGEKPRMEVDLRVRFHDEPEVATPCNTLAEIAGTDLKDELVMLGAHLDSWHSATGATDNGCGVAAAMEAVRIIRACGLKPRRTIRIALWTGEEQGLLGSKAYVAKHFGKFEVEKAATQPATVAASGPASRPARRLVRMEEYEKLSAYFNLDVGTGKVRGIYMQSNEAVRPIFRRWLAPLADLGAETLSLASFGGTDHLSFDEIGLPAFQFIQDPIEYWTRTHHSNFDVYDRVQAEDLKQAAVILAAFVYDAAMAEERLPRKATPK